MDDIKPKLSRFKSSARCTTCKFSMEHKRFHQDLLNSSYFDKDSLLSIPQILKKHKCRIEYRSVMNHVQHHIAPVKRKNDEKVKLLVSEAEVVKAISAPDPKTFHEAVLDETITEFRRKLKDGKIKITATQGLQAIKIRADIDSKNKDRGLDFLKAFSSMGQNE